MTKREYLQANYEAVVYNPEISPFKNVDTVEKGLYNYQYYNALAKEMKSLSTQKNIEWEMKKDYLERSNHYYAKKDQATKKVLDLLDYQNVTAYMIKVKSKYLKGRLFEIVLDQNQMILHSTNTVILNKLKEEGVFLEGSKRSLIDQYINQRY